MARLFEGEADGRQSDDVSMATSRFRPRYRKLTEEEKALHDDIKRKAEELEHLYDRARSEPSGRRYYELAVTSLEQSVMWIIKELTS